jgi:hypothetical protein
MAGRATRRGELLPDDFTAAYEPTGEFRRRDVVRKGVVVLIWEERWTTPEGERWIEVR